MLFGLILKRKCVFSIGVLSHMSKFSFIYAPQTSQPYVRIGWMAVTNIFRATRIDSLEKFICFRILKMAFLSCCESSRKCNSHSKVSIFLNNFNWCVINRK